MMESQDAGTITVDEVKNTPPQALTFIDIRKHPDGQQLRGALRYDGSKLLEADKLSLPLSHDGKIVVYCGHGNSCVAVAQAMRDKGFENAVALAGGYEAAKAAGLPVEELTQEQPIPGQEDAGIKLL